MRRKKKENEIKEEEIKEWKTEARWKERRRKKK